MPHDFVSFPELTNSQMQIYYFESPHKQILENFRADCVKVHDGDTITVRWYMRDFDFPIRFNNTNAPELNQPGGRESQKWLEAKILGKTIDIIVDPKERVGKYGRLLGIVMSSGLNIGRESVDVGKAVRFDQKAEGEVPELNKAIPQFK